MRKKKKGTTKCDKYTVQYDVETVQCEDGIIKYEKKNKGTTKCDKRIITCDVGITQCENETVKCKKKIRESRSVTKEQSRIMLVLHNVKMELSNMRKK